MLIINKKGGASVFSSVFLINYTSSIPLREEHKRRLSSYNEQQRKERAREEETTLFFCSFLPFYLRSKLWEEERRLICFLKGVLRWKRESHFPFKEEEEEEEDKERDDENCVFVKGKKEEKEVSFDDASS